MTGQRSNQCRIIGRLRPGLRFTLVSLAFIGLILPPDTLSADTLGELDLTVVDAKSQEPIPVRLRMLDSRGRHPRIRNVPKQGKDFTFSNLLTFKVKTGKYNFTVDRGPHYQQRSGTLEVKRDGFDQKTLSLPRFVDMHKEGWYSGDVWINRDPDHLPILLDAEEVDIAVQPTWSLLSKQKLKDRKPRPQEVLATGIVDFSAGVLNAEGGRLITLGLPVDQANSATEWPQDAVSFAAKAKSLGGQVIVADLSAWDLPALIASGSVDAVSVLHDDLRLLGDEKRSLGRAPSEARFEGQHGVGRYSESIYYHLLNCGVRIPPAAYSGSGNCDNPPGYNRTYVACGQDFSADTWWQNFCEGRSIVSNGPVLRARVNEQLPGYVFQSQTGRPLKLDIACNLGTRQKVEYLEIIKNGRVVESMRLDKWAANGGRLPTVEFTESGWLMVRAFAPGETNFRCAFTAPFYVEFDGKPIVSERSAKYFVDWVFDRARRIQRSKLTKDEKKRRIDQQRIARDFWQAKLDNATTQ